jgi:DNA polymerase-3 subunit gamma/tau
MLQAIGELEPRFRRSGQQQLLTETLLVRFALLDRAVDLEDVLRSIGGSGDAGSSSGGGGSGSGPFARPEPRPAPRAEASGSNSATGRPAAESPAARAASVPDGARVYRPAPVPERPGAVASAPPVKAVGSPATATSRALPSTAEVTGRWDDLVERFRTTGKPMLASALVHAGPVSVAASGLLVLELDEPNDIYAHSIQSARGEVLAALRDWFPSLDRVEIRAHEQPSAPPKRLTDEMIRAERIASLRKRDPVLNAAIDALDLDVTD